MVVRVGPQLPIVLQSKHVHLPHLNDQLFDNLHAEEEDSDEEQDLSLAVEHDEFEASLSVQVGVLDPQKLLLHLV